MIAITNMDKPQNCWDCVRHFDFECSGDIRDCPIIEIDEEIWEALKPKVETMSMALTGWRTEANATQCVESVE